MKKLFLMATLAACLLACKKEEKQPVEQPSPVESISFSEESVSMNEGAKIYANEYLTILPTSVGDTATVTWSSSNESVATVNEYGTVTAKKAGETTITASSNRKSASMTVIVNRIPVTKMTVPSKMSLTMKVWKPVPITVEPENASTGNLRFHFFCDDPKVNLYAKPRVEYKDGSWWMICEQGGSFHLDAICDESGDSIRSEVNVYSIPATKIDFAQSTYKVNIGDTIATSLIWTPDSATFQNATYTSDDITIATVNKNGVIKGLKEGAVTITAKTGSLTATCTATVGNFVYKPVQSLTCSIDHIWMQAGKSNAITIPNSAFTVSPADATRPEISITSESGSNNINITRTTEGWTITGVDFALRPYLEDNLVVKADNKTIKIPFVLVSSRFWQRMANPFIRTHTAERYGVLITTTIGQELPACFGDHIKMQLLKIEEKRGGAFTVEKGQVGEGAYITKPQKITVEYNYVTDNTEYYYRYGYNHFGTTTYQWKLTLDGFYGKESEVAEYQYDQVFRSGFSHYTMTISTPNKVYFTCSSQETSSSDYVTCYHRRYQSNHGGNRFDLNLNTKTPDFISDPDPFTIRVVAYADHMETSAATACEYKVSNGAALMDLINDCMDNEKGITLGRYGKESDLEHDVITLRFLTTRADISYLVYKGYNRYGYTNTKLHYQYHQ